MKSIHLILFFGLFLSIQAQQYPVEKFSSRQEYAKWIDNHPYNLRPPLTKKEIKAMPKEDRPDLAAEQDFLKTLDPVLGYPPRDRLIPALKKVKAFKENHSQRTAPGSANLPWVERGPTNIAGRTRALVFDPNDLNGNRVFAGGVAGGLWYNDNITDTNSPWNKIDDFWDNIAVSTIGFDPTNPQVAYVGTGEGWFNIDAMRGYGIWKTTDGGTTWNHLTSTTGSAFNYVQKIVVHPISGDVYAATRNGLRRSQNGGTTWSEVLGSSNGSSSDSFADVEISANNTIYTSAGVGNTDGIYKSTSGNSGSWTKLNTGTNGFPITDIKRIELALAPSNANIVYAVAQSSGSGVKGLYRSDNQGSTWNTLALPNDADGGISSDDFSRGQAWYDLTMAVDPNNSSRVVVGGVDLFKSTNSGSSWTQISHWYGGYGFPYVHADQHALVFKPGSSSVLINGNDGGVFYTSNFTSVTPSWAHPTLNYNVTQFYSCAISPDAGSSNFLAGSQDNGTQKFTQPGFASTTTATGGDGAYCFIDQTSSNIQITSYVYNTYYVSTNGGNSFNTLINDGNSGSFINPADYDDNLNILYTYKNTTALVRISGIGTTNTVSDLNLALGSTVRHIRVSPYTTNSTTLFVGTSAGNIFKVSNANTGSPTLIDIDQNGDLPIGSISCIEIGSSENELLVTFSNFGVNSVWYTSDGGNSWTSKEGDLPDMPVRWALFLPNVSGEVILGTEVGVWSTANINAPSPSWVPSNTGLANTRVDMLQCRSSDFEIIAATHGRGLFSSTSALLDLDVTIQEITSPSIELCDSIFTPSIIFKNNGQLTLNSVQFELFVDNISIETVSWIGSLANGAQSSVSFSEYTSTSGNHTIRVESSLPNGGVDENLLNDVLESEFMIFHIKVAEYINDLEDNLVPPTDWLLVNGDGGLSWEYWDLNTSYDCNFNIAAVIRHFHYGGSGQVDEMISPPVIKGIYNNLKLVFDYAHGQIFANDNSKLEIFASGDCGNTWDLKWSKSGDELATAPDSIWFYTPACDDWVRDTIDLSEFDETGVMVKFAATNGGSGNIYLDNLNITGDIPGCTDPNALNYNPIANLDDGSCFYCDLTVNIEVIMDTCVGTNDISLTAVPISNVSNTYSYSWVDGLFDEISTSISASGLSQGYYYVQVTDDYNCTATEEVTLNEFGITNIEVLGQGTCEPLDNTYTQDIRISFIQYPEIFNFDIEVNGQQFPVTGSPQIVSLTSLIADGLSVDIDALITDNLGCIESLPDAFIAPANCSVDCNVELQYTLAANDFCVNDGGGSIDLSINSNNPPVVVSWTGPNGFVSSGSNLTNLEMGMYYLNLSDQYCAKQDSVWIDGYGVINITSLSQSECDPLSNTYSQTLEIEYLEFTNYQLFDLIINGNSYALSGSPQQVTMDNLVADGLAVDLNAHFTNEITCEFNAIGLFNAPQYCQVNCETDLLFSIIVSDYCVNDPGGTIDLVVTAFNNSVDVAWSGPNGFTSTFFNLVDVQKGWYVATVTDAYCTKQDSIEIEAFGVTAISAISQTPCDNQTNNYDQILEISYEEFSGFENFQLDVNGYLFPATGSPQLITLNELTADGLPVNVTAFLTNDVSCFSVEQSLFTAPVACFVDCETALSFSLASTDYCVNDAGGTIDLTLIEFTNPGNFSWTGPNGYTSNLLFLTNLEKGWYFVTVTDANCVKQDSIEVEAYGITDIISVSQSACDGLTNTYSQTLEVSYEEFTGYENFQIDVNGFLFTPTGSPQQMTLTGLIANGLPVDVSASFSNQLSCVYSASGLFTAPSDCTINCESDLLFTLAKTDYCTSDNGGTITTNLVAYSNPVSYSWVGPNGFTSTSSDLTDVTEGTYTLTVTDAYCVKQDSITIESFGIISLTPLFQSLCDNETNTYDQTIEVAYSEFSGYENFSLSVNGNLYTPTSSPQQIVLYDLNSDGLSVDVVASMTNDVSCVFNANQLFVAPVSCECLTQVNIGADTIMCEGESIVISTSGGNFVTYLWQDGSNAPTLLVDTSGLYIVDVIDDLGCTSSDSVLVTFQSPPLIEAGPDQLVCPDEDIFLTGEVSPSSFTEWGTVFGTGIIGDINALSTSVSNLSLGVNTFILEVNDVVCGLISDVVNVQVEDVTPPVLNCSFDTIVVVNAMPYVLGDLSSLLSISDDCSGTFTIDQVPAVGEELIDDQPILFSVADESNNSSQCSIDLILDYQTICLNGFYPAPVNLETVTVPGGYNLNWDPVPNSIVCQVNGGKVGGSQVNLNIFEFEPFTKFVSIGILNPGDTYQWRVRCACQLGPVVAGPFSSYEFFTVPTVGINQFTNQNEESIEVLSLYPNPAYNQVEVLIYNQEADALLFEVVDVLGTNVHHVVINSRKGQNLMSIDLTNLPSGNYYLKVSGSKGISGTHFVISR